jgi:hypothetical protein
VLREFPVAAIITRSPWQPASAAVFNREKD